MHRTNLSLEQNKKEEYDVMQWTVFDAYFMYFIKQNKPMVSCPHVSPNPITSENTGKIS